MLTLGSLFDGIGGWQIAAQRAGIKPLWSSEIERFPRAVTAAHFPDTLQLGDITQIDGAAIPPVDIVTMGSPCQDLSIAGKRKGLEGERSGLFLRAIRLIRDMRVATHGRNPRYVVWENVSGAFSSNKGADFRAVLEAFAEAEIPMPKNGKWADGGMVECDKCEIAWRILDAQYWGVAQRRRRIFLVADFGVGRRCAEQILFESQGMSRDTAAGTETREETPCGAAGGARVSSEMGSDCLTPWDVQSRRIYPVDAVFPTLYSGECRGRSDVSVFFQSEKPMPVAVYDMTHADEVMREVTGGKVQTLNARMGTGGNQVPVIHAYVSRSYHEYAADTIGAALRASGGNYGGGSENLAETYGYVRRLTPLECERLQGLPDGWTLIDNVSCSDTSRYKAIGNGMAQPCPDWILNNIQKETYIE